MTSIMADSHHGKTTTKISTTGKSEKRTTDFFILALYHKASLSFLDKNKAVGKHISRNTQVNRFE